MISLGAIREPIGTIKPWLRANNTVPLPLNWLICDGTTVSDPESDFNGKALPDLRSNFPEGHATLTNANFGSDTLYYAGGTIPSGGGSSHSHSVNSHSHGIPSQAGHRHGGRTGMQYPYTTQGNTGRGNGELYFIGSDRVFKMDLDTNMNENASHDHGGSTNGAGSSTGSGANIPPYLGLVYIIKIK